MTASLQLFLIGYLDVTILVVTIFYFSFVLSVTRYLFTKERTMSLVNYPVIFHLYFAYCYLVCSSSFSLITEKDLIGKLVSVYLNLVCRQ